MPEEICAAARSGNDGELATPHGDRFGHPVKKALIGMESEFVKGDVATLAGQSVGVGREAVDAAAIGELKSVGGGIGVLVEKDLAQIGGAQVKDFGPVDAVFDL